jgi:hypothetical protein
LVFGSRGVNRLNANVLRAYRGEFGVAHRKERRNGGHRKYATELLNRLQAHHDSPQIPIGKMNDPTKVF